MSDDTPDIDLDLLKKAAESIGEHFDAIQIFASRHESGLEGGTINVSYGGGSWFARYGQVKEWVVRAEEQSKMQARKDMD